MAPGCSNNSDDAPAKPATPTDMLLFIDPEYVAQHSKSGEGGEGGEGAITTIQYTPEFAFREYRTSVDKMMGEAGGRALLSKKTSMSKGKLTSLLSTMRGGTGVASANTTEESGQEHAEGLENPPRDNLSSVRRQLSVDPATVPEGSNEDGGEGAAGKPLSSGPSGGGGGDGHADADRVETLPPNDTGALERHLSMDGPSNGNAGAGTTSEAESPKPKHKPKPKQNKAAIKAERARARRAAAEKKAEELDMKVEKGLSSSRNQLKEIRLRLQAMWKETVGVSLPNLAIASHFEMAAAAAAMEWKMQDQRAIRNYLARGEMGIAMDGCDVLLEALDQSLAKPAMCDEYQDELKEMQAKLTRLRRKTVMLVKSMTEQIMEGGGEEGGGDEGEEGDDGEDEGAGIGGEGGEGGNGSGNGKKRRVTLVIPGEMMVA